MQHVVSAARALRRAAFVAAVLSSWLAIGASAFAAIQGVDGADWTLDADDLPANVAIQTGGFSGNAGIGVENNLDTYQTFRVTTAETGGFDLLAVDSFWLGYDSSIFAHLSGFDQAFTLRLFEIPDALTASGNPPTGVEIWNSGPTSSQTLGSGIERNAGLDSVVMIDVSTRQIVLEAGKDYAFQIDDDNATGHMALKYGTGYANGVSVSGGVVQGFDLKFAVAGEGFNRIAEVPEPLSVSVWSVLALASTVIVRRGRIARICGEQ